MAIDRSKLKRYSIGERSSKVRREDFAARCEPGKTFSEFLAGLPDILQAKGLVDLVNAVVSAIEKDKPVLLLYGAHVVKTGLSPLLSQALQEGWVTYAGTNGAGTIHDLELALFGKTSEDVAEALDEGMFGMAEETGREWNRAVVEGAANGLGLGESIGRGILERAGDLSGSDTSDSIAVAAVEAGRPLTVHAAIGADITHPHPEADGAAIGATSYRDFETLCERVAELDEGGVVLNVGSAVILPEVFLKALSVARNLHGSVGGFTAANLDMIRHYRPRMNILERPTRTSGKAIEITGPHEILIPLLFQAVRERLGS